MFEARPGKPTPPEALAVPDAAVRTWLGECAARIAPMVCEGYEYAGVGSQATDPRVLQWMTKLASRLEARGMILNSGGASGADTAFEYGVRDHTRAQIFLPRKGFNGNQSPLWKIPAEAYEVASKHHPVWHALKPQYRDLHARNVQQVLGEKVHQPVRFVVCWTADAADGVTILTTRATGGTGTAIRIAASYGVPVVNLMPSPAWLRQWVASQG